MNRELLVVCFLLTFTTTFAGAQDMGPPSDDEKAIVAAVDSYVAAFNNRDATAVAEHWSEEGTYISSVDGQQFAGREALKTEFETLFSDVEDVSMEVFMEVSMNSLRFITKDVAIEDGTAIVFLGDGVPTESNYTVIHVKQDGKWLMDSVREVILPEGELDDHPIQELEWMIGEWISQDQDTTVETVCRWTKNRNFITRTFATKIEDEIDMEGTQVIGWDPASKHFRTWVFDTDGGFGEGVCSGEGNRWIIKAKATLPGGELASAVHIMTKIDDDTITWQSISREVDGKLLPNVEPVTVVRKPSSN